jgi:hypothetical protein
MRGIESGRPHIRNIAGEVPQGNDEMAVRKSQFITTQDLADKNQLPISFWRNPAIMLTILASRIKTWFKG